MLECVVNISEGRDFEILERLTSSCADVLLDVHVDADHHRSVLTLAGSEARLNASVQALARTAVDSLDLRRHTGAHPRFGVLDVVPFVALDDDGRAFEGGGSRRALSGAMAARDDFAEFMGGELSVPCLLYGPLADGSERTLPEVRRNAFGALAPDRGPSAPHPSAGAVAVGARGVLVAYNLWLSGPDVAIARAVAAAVRGPYVRALGLDLGGAVQVSCNLVAPFTLGPAELYDTVAAELADRDGRIERAELVGLIPEDVLLGIPATRWDALGLSKDDTLEGRLRRS
jgi:glutamate formiminotransferase